MKKLGILFTARNNYEMYDLWFSNSSSEGFEVLNIDEDSTEENKEYGREVCSKYGMTYMDREKRGMFNNVETAKKYFKTKGIDWVIWFHLDCYPITENFFSRLNELILADKLNEFGVISFNVCHGWEDIDSFVQGDTSLKVTCRAALEPGDYYYRHKTRILNGSNSIAWPNSRVDYSTGKFDKPFSIESAGFGVLVNFDKWTKHIEINDGYIFYMSWDDICYQFLYDNVHNLCIPDLTLAHAFQTKKQFDIPNCSVKGTEDQLQLFFGEVNDEQAHATFRKRWGFDYRTARRELPALEDTYKGTLIWDFFQHDPKNGPLKSFDL